MAKTNKRFKSRDEKDLNTNYNYVNPNDIVEFDGTTQEFLARITHRKPGYMMKPNGRIIIHWWWETKESWFMNHGKQRITKQKRRGFDGENGWYIATQMGDIIGQHLHDGYKMYLKSQK